MSGSTEAKERLQHAPRIDMRPKVTGSAKYIEDLPEPAGLLYGAVLTSPYSHAKIVSIDSSASGTISRCCRRTASRSFGRFSSAAAAAAKRAFQTDRRSAFYRHR